jgi:hypothetical protein
MLSHSMSAMPVVASPVSAVVEVAAAVTGTAVGNDEEVAHLLVGPHTAVGSPKDVTPRLWHTPSTPSPVCRGDSRVVPHSEFHSTALQVHMPQAVSPTVCKEDSPEGILVLPPYRPRYSSSLTPTR